MALLRCVLGRVKSSAIYGHCSYTKILPFLVPINNNSSISLFPSFGNFLRSCSSSSSTSPSDPERDTAQSCYLYLSKLKYGPQTLEDAATSELIKGFAQFAVKEQNDKENSQLELVRVIGATRYSVAGKRYHITVEAMDAGKPKKYLAQVWVKPWLNFVSLFKWEPIDDAHSTNGLKQGMKNGGNRLGDRVHVWTNEEEEELLRYVEELVACNGVLKLDCLNLITTHMASMMPQSNIKKKHVEARMRKWRTDYYDLTDILSTAGFGWDPTQNMVVADDDANWELYFQNHPCATWIRNKTFPHSQRLSKLFVPLCWMFESR